MNDPSDDNSAPLGLTFPCQFPVKAMGPNHDDFETLVVGIVHKHIADPATSQIQRKLSSGGRFRSVTVVINAESRAQLDAIYLELNAQEQVVMVL